MRLRYWAIGVALVGSISGLAVAMSNEQRVAPVPQALATLGDWAPRAITEPPAKVAQPLASAPRRADAASAVERVAVPYLASIDADYSAYRLPQTAWSRTITAGETLDALLGEAGVDGPDRAEVALALGAEFDLRHLRPGHVLKIGLTPSGAIQSAALEVDEGVIIEALFGESTTTRTLKPEPETVVLAGESTIDSSLFEALEQAAIPARFAVDLAQMLGGTVDFRRELKGGETLRILWREARLGDERIGQPEITFAALDLGDALYEVVWPEDGTGRATIYVNGEVLRVFAQPVDGARLSSVFGKRRHPVYGNVRMHTGVDFAAAKGTPVRATAPGRVSFVGWRGGYGRVVEIAHGANTTTRYTHLSAVPAGLVQGKRVMAGDVIGSVGATGTATGPNLHYEVLVDGRPTDPMSDDRLAAATADGSQSALADDLLQQARTSLDTRLSAGPAPNRSERL